MSNCPEGKSCSDHRSRRCSRRPCCKGPSLAVDTACSSSIVTAHMARVAIGSGAIAAAASAGVQFIANFLSSGLFNSAGMLAPDGRCKTLDAAANGAVCGAWRTRCITRHRPRVAVADVSVNTMTRYMGSFLDFTV